MPPKDQMTKENLKNTDNNTFSSQNDSISYKNSRCFVSIVHFQEKLSSIFPSNNDCTGRNLEAEEMFRNPIEDMQDPTILQKDRTINLSNFKLKIRTN